MNFYNVDPYYYRPTYAYCITCDNYEEVDENQICIDGHDDDEIDYEESPFTLITMGFSCQ